ncbi:MAG: NAD(P)/FAD-dependent oxidoreductase, partial [Bacteroidetes bacterium]
MKIVIVGAGFAGLKLARSLNNKAGFDVLLIDRFNYHQFQPLFYQVATASLDASNVSFPLRKMFHNSRNVRIKMANLERIDSAQNVLFTDIGNFEYDVLVLATGADTNFFGNSNFAQHCFPMKTTAEALRLRHKLIHNFEDALQVTDPAALQRLMTIVVVGAGPTGVELSGAIAEMKQYVLPKDYPDLDFSAMKIILLEGSSKTLAAMSSKSSAQSQAYLEKLGVDVQTNAQVQAYDGQQIRLNDGREIPTAMVIWAAGIKGNVPEGIGPELMAKGNRICVDRHNKVLSSSNIYALGDLAYMETPLYEHGHPQVANVAIGQAKLLSKNLQRLQAQKSMQQYEYMDKGSMATIGRHLAVVDIPKPKLHFKGFFAWFIWMGLHLFLLVGVKN